MSGSPLEKLTLSPHNPPMKPIHLNENNKQISKTYQNLTFFSVTLYDINFVQSSNCNTFSVQIYLLLSQHDITYMKSFAKKLLRNPA